MGNPGPQPRPVHSCGQAYRPNILRYMKHMGFKRQPTIPPTFMVPEGTPSNEKVAAVIRQVEQAHHQLFGKLPGPPPRPDLVEKVSLLSGPLSLLVKDSSAVMIRS